MFPTLTLVMIAIALIGLVSPATPGIAKDYSKAIAQERAPTIASVIQRICGRAGIPRAANTAPRKANGSANSVCSILIISSVVRIFRAVAVNIIFIGSRAAVFLPSHATPVNPSSALRKAKAGPHKIQPKTLHSPTITLQSAIHRSALLHSANKTVMSDE